MFGAGQHEYEVPYPPLDHKPTADTPQYIGVAVLQANVRISKPSAWIIRAASNRPGSRYIQYVSPHAYVVSLYERSELPNAPWHDVLARYEKQLRDTRAEIVVGAVPMAIANGQGRAFVVRRKVPGAKAPFIGVSREYLVRGDDRVVLVQIVHPTVGIAPMAKELSRVLQTLELR
jgi:hypothetical protein